MAKKEIVVIGIGRFATELINKLNTRAKYSIVAIDKDPKKVEQLTGVKNIIVGDATDKNFLLNVGIDNADYYVVGMGQDFQSSLVISSIIKENFKGKVFCKSVDDNHASILKTIGVEEVITPEVAAARIAFKKMINPMVDLIAVDDLYSITEVTEGIVIVNMPVTERTGGKQIKDIDVPEGTSIALMKRDGIGQVVNGSTQVEVGDVLSVIGSLDEILKLLETTKKQVEEDITDEKELETK